MKSPPAPLKSSPDHPLAGIGWMLTGIGIFCVNDALGKWLVANYSDQFVEVAAEKLLTYALGRGIDPAGDMPLVRSISHDAAKHENRFSTLVLDVVKSKAFQMNMKVQENPATTGGD